MKAWIRLCSWVDGRPLAERRLLMVVCTVVVAAAWYGLLQGPLLRQITEAQQASEELRRAIAADRAAFGELSRALDSDPTLMRRQALARLQQEIDRLDGELRNRAVSVVSPVQMVEALRDLLLRQRKLKLVSLRNLAPVPVTEPGSAPTPSQQTPQVYRHSVRVEFSGEYFAIVDYLRALEALPWKFQWDDLRVEMERYPVARVVMHINTLSLGDIWIGV